MTQKSTLGITVLFDVMAIGKPVIITENPYIDIDVEKEGIGYWVAEGDVKGWVSKINLLIENPDLCDTLGKKSYSLHKSTYNMDNFGASLKLVFQSLAFEKLDRKSNEVNDKTARKVILEQAKV